MTSNREFDGKDLAEALHAASRRLGIPEPDLDYTIVDAGRRGLFGLGARPVRIRVMPPVDIPSTAEVLAQPTPERRQPPPTGSRPARPGPARGPRNPRGSGSEAPPPRDRKPRRSRRRSRRPDKPHKGTAPLSRPQGPGDAEAARPVVETVRRMFELADVDISVVGERFDSEVALSLSGSDLDRFVTKESDGIQALQFVLNRMARRTWPDLERISVSGTGDRSDRDEELIELTREVAQQVAGTGRSKTLHEMNAYERRLVHLTVREFDGLRSSSAGDGPLKRVRISRAGGDRDA